jgi:hypothetical protein
MHELDLSIAVQSIDNRIQRITHNPVTALHAGFFQHLPQQVRNIRHVLPPGRPSSCWSAADFPSIVRIATSMRRTIRRVYFL